MAGRIYLLSNDSKLLAMEEVAYESERLLQQLLAEHPDLLAGEQINADEPRRWLLVTREMVVPGELDGSGRWSLDHLFLEQDAIPTLVEVKRSTDTRIRREVVGRAHLKQLSHAGALWTRSARCPGRHKHRPCAFTSTNSGDHDSFFSTTASSPPMRRLSELNAVNRRSSAAVASPGMLPALQEKLPRLGQRAVWWYETDPKQTRGANLSRRFMAVRSASSSRMQAFTTANASTLRSWSVRKTTEMFRVARYALSGHGVFRYRPPP